MTPALVLIWPLDGTKSNESASAPPSLYVRVLSPSARTGLPTLRFAGVFSAKLRTAGEASRNTGGLLPAVKVLPMPDGDQALTPSPLRASTCASYAVPACNPVMTVFVCVPLCDHERQASVLPFFRYCTS